MPVVMETDEEETRKVYTVRHFKKRLNKFEDLIREITCRSAEEATLEERKQWICENLRFDQFCEKVRKLFGSGVENKELKSIYQKISTAPDTEVDWSELYSCFRTNEQEELVQTGEDQSIFLLSGRRRVGDRKARDTVQCLTYIRALDSYICCSQKGAVSVWTGKLRLQSAVDINEPSWITGCDYLPGLRRVGCCTVRSIALWENRIESQNIVVIKPIDNSPLCMASVDSDNGEPVDLVLFGDDQGYVNLLTVAAKDLVMRDDNVSNRKSKTDICVIDPSELSVPIQRRKLHTDCVVRVKYFPELSCFASCSPSSLDSFVLADIEKVFTLNEDVRSVSIPKGVNCFELCAKANIIATGGSDRIIRLWHPHIFARPTGRLVGHLFSIIDITTNERDQHVISLCDARIFRVWDIHTLTCLQVFSNSDGRLGQRRINTMIFDNINERLLAENNSNSTIRYVLEGSTGYTHRWLHELESVTTLILNIGSSVIETWPLSRSVQIFSQVPHTHDKAIVQVLLNSQLKQVVSVCSESVIKAWKMDAGRLVYTIPDAHGPNVEVTALNLDKTGLRMVSGALDGSIRVWDCAAGHVLKAKQNSETSQEENMRITGIVCLQNGDGYLIVAIGWNNKLRMYMDAKDTNSLVLLQEFSDLFNLPLKQLGISQSETQVGLSTMPDCNLQDPFASTDSSPPIWQSKAQTHVLGDNVMTCMTSVTSDLLATGCSNGNIILWSIEESCIKKIFALPRQMGSNNQPRIDRESQQVNDVKLLVYKTGKLDTTVFKNMTDKHKLSDLQTESKRHSFTDSQSSLHTNRISKGTRLTSTNGNRVHGTIAATSGTLETGQLYAREAQSKVGDKIEATVGDIAAILDPDTKVAVKIYKHILVSVHQDSIIRFWDMNGVLVQEVSSAPPNSNIHVTSICHDEDVNILVTGDSKGYLTMWNVEHFLENQMSQEDKCPTQIISWRGHLRKIVTLVYVDALKVILSGSLDGSVRVWWGKKGTFVGFFGQYYPFHLPSSEDISDTSVLPFDINEEPVTHIKSQLPPLKILPAQTLECPLNFDNTRWQPFRRSAYIARKVEIQRPEDKKFFRALIKPKAENGNSHWESFIVTKKANGAVYRSLQVYRIYTPKKPTTLDFLKCFQDNEEAYKKSSVTVTTLALTKVMDMICKHLINHSIPSDGKRPETNHWQALQHIKGKSSKTQQKNKENLF